jgi:hypothetical protein
MFTWCGFEGFSLESVEAQNSHPCIFFDYRGLETPHDEDPQNFNRNFPYKATAYVGDVGLSWRVRRPIEFGLGVGFVATSANDHTVVRPTLTAPRLLIEPVALGREVIVAMFKQKGKPSLQSASYWNGKSPLWHTLKFYVTGNVILGPLSQASFGVTGTNYDYRNKEFVVSRGFIFDFGEFFPPIARR